MAWFTYQCAECRIEFTRNLAKREYLVKCDYCGNSARNVVKVGSSSVFERLDNGAMARAVERPHNIEEMMDERADPTTPQEESFAGDTDKERSEE